MVRLESFLLAAVLTAPAIKEAFIDGTMPLEEALVRFVVATVVFSIALSILRSIYYSYAAAVPHRRRTDRLLELPDPRAAAPTETLAAVDADKPSPPADRREPPSAS